MSLNLCIACGICLNQGQGYKDEPSTLSPKAPKPLNPKPLYKDKPQDPREQSRLREAVTEQGKLGGNLGFRIQGFRV